MGQGLESDLEKILATLSARFADEGKARQVAILTESRATIVQSHYDNWDGGVYSYTSDLVLPEFLFQQLGGKGERERLEKDFLEHCTDISRLYDSEHIERCKILTELSERRGAGNVLPGTEAVSAAPPPRVPVQTAATPQHPKSSGRDGHRSRERPS